MVDPLSLQNVIVRSHEVAKVQKISQGGTEEQALAFAQELTKKAQKAEENISQSPTAEKTNIQEQKEQKKKKKGKNSQEANSKIEEDKNSPADGQSGNLIDVRA
ncbi:MAG: hypothetical protein PWP04_409 [Candidatus Atribacteria bacterium]|nr:hypothetical protein [Candidatus Atribacteria bacterium]